MKSLLMIAAAAMMTVTLHAADLAGTWKGSMETQMGQTDVTLTLKTGAVTGTAQLGEYQGAIEKGALDGAKIHFEVNIEHGKVTFDGTVAGEEIKFEVTGTQGTKYALVCKRASGNAH